MLLAVRCRCNQLDAVQEEWACEHGHGSLLPHLLLLTTLHGRCDAAGDWLQGPYVYALYQHYGFGRGDIGRLFIAGFGSSMIFGTIVGSLADRK